MGRPGRPKGSKDRIPRKRQESTYLRTRRAHYDALMTCAKALRISMVDLIGKLADAMRLQNPHLFRAAETMEMPDLTVDALRSADDRVKPRRPPKPGPDPDAFRLIPKGDGGESGSGAEEADG